MDDRPRRLDARLTTTTKTRNDDADERRARIERCPERAAVSRNPGRGDAVRAAAGGAGADAPNSFKSSTARSCGNIRRKSRTRWR